MEETLNEKTVICLSADAVADILSPAIEQVRSYILSRSAKTLGWEQRLLTKAAFQLIAKI